ncbi:hypothetical protein T484DRAFT_1818999, partial [Baffinella frigidus]
MIVEVGEVGAAGLFEGAVGNDRFELVAWWEAKNASAGPAAGGTVVEVSGRGFRFDVNYSCTFEAANATGNATEGDVFSTREVQVLDHTRLVCVTPFWDAPAQLTLLELDELGLSGGRRRLEINASKEEDETVEAREWRFGEGVRSVLPSRAPASGGVALVVGAFGLSTYMGSANYTVVFSTLDVPEEALAEAADADSNSTAAIVVEAVSPNELELVSPSWGSSRATVARLNIFIFHESTSLETVDGDTLVFSFDGQWSARTPSAGPSEAGTRVTISGAGFSEEASSGYACRFVDADNATRAVDSEVVEWLNHTEIVCVTREWPFEQALTNLSVSFDGAEMVYSGAEPAEFYFVNSWSELDVSVGTAAGGTALNISGAGFDSEVDYECVFTGWDTAWRAASNATVVSINEVACVTPHWNATAEETVVSIESSGGAAAYTGEDVNGSYFTFTARWSLVQPNPALAGGGVMVSVESVGLNMTGHYQCVWSLEPFFNDSIPTSGDDLATSALPTMYTTATVRNFELIECPGANWGYTQPAGNVS